MSQSVLSATVDRVRRITGRAEPNDAELVVRFGATGDPAAFAGLVARHGPMVLAVCRRATRHRQDAEDAFQAAFLVLAKRAGELDPPGAVAGWLFGVAVNAAREARRRTARRAARETLMATPPETGRCEPEPDFDTRAAVAEEVAGLPERYRSLVVACDLQGEPQPAVARRLGVPVGTVYSRLSTARRLLADRLRQRGVGTATIAAALAGFAPDATALPAVSDFPSTSVTELTEAMMVRGSALRWKLTACALLACVALGLGGEPTPKSAPAIAPRPRAADESRLVLGFGGHIRFLKPDGAEVSHVTGAQVLKAGADVPTRTATIGFSSKTGLTATVSETFGPCGRAAPDGRLPLDTRKGLYLLTPGTPPVVAPVKAAKSDEALFASDEVPHIVAWSPDGKQAVGHRLNRSLLSPPAHEHMLIDLVTGTTTALNLPKNHQVVGWAPDGWFLTIGEERLGGAQGWAVKEHSLCKFSADGRTSTVLASHSFKWEQPRSGEWLHAAALSPDGKRVACLVVTTQAPAEEKTEPLTDLKLTTFDVANSERTTVVYEAPGKRVEARMLAHMPGTLSWAPDGARLAFSTYSHDYRASELVSASWRVHVIGADGKGAKAVFTSDFPGGHGIPEHLQVDWR